MAAYLVLMQQVDDVDRYRAEYLPAWRPFLKKHGAEVMVAGFDAEPAEGTPPNSTSCCASPTPRPPGGCSTTRSTVR